MHIYFHSSYFHFAHIYQRGPILEEGTVYSQCTQTSQITESPVGYRHRSTTTLNGTYTLLSNWNHGGISCDVHFAGNLRSNGTNL